MSRIDQINHIDHIDHIDVHEDRRWRRVLLVGTPVAWIALSTAVIEDPIV